jgi:hypothetical protein
MNSREKRLARVNPKLLDLMELTVISRDPNAVLRALSRQRRDDYQYAPPR